MADHGSFIWYELMTTDMKAAAAFYAKVVGWGTQDVSSPGMPYTLVTVKGVSVGGVMELPEEARRMDARPRWIGYVGVDDVDAAARRIVASGGVLHVPPTDISNISRFSVVADPHMAMFALVKWRNRKAEEPAALGAAGRVGWHELLAGDTDQALAFYGDVFGWQKAGTDAGSTGAYELFAAGGRTIGGMFTKPAAVPMAFWLYYFNVGDIDAAAKRAKAAGGEILNGPMKVPDGSWIVGCTDPQGAMFALVGKRGSNALGYFERVTVKNLSSVRAGRWSW